MDDVPSAGHVVGVEIVVDVISRQHWLKSQPPRYSSDPSRSIGTRKHSGPHLASAGLYAPMTPEKDEAIGSKNRWKLRESGAVLLRILLSSLIFCGRFDCRYQSPVFMDALRPLLPRARPRSRCRGTKRLCHCPTAEWPRIFRRNVRPR